MGKLDSLSSPSASEIRSRDTKGKIEAETGLHFSMKTFLMRFPTEPIHNLNNRKLEPRSLQTFNPLDLASKIFSSFFFMSSSSPFLLRRIYYTRKIKYFDPSLSISREFRNFRKKVFFFFEEIFQELWIHLFFWLRKIIIILTREFGIYEKLKFHTRNWKFTDCL